MNRQQLSLMVTITVAVGAIFEWEDLQAQEWDGPIEEIVITATKREQALFDVPMAVQSLSSVQIEQAAIRELSDVINFIPGASEGRTTNAGTRVYQLRGVASFYGDSTVGYYVDEAPYALPNRNWAPLLPAFDVERIEVLRGPQGTLYGLGSMGGTIRFITRDPNLEKPGFEARFGASDTDGGDANYYGDFAASVPLIRDKLGVRLTASREERGGFAESPTFPGEKDKDTIDNYRLKLLWEPIESFRLKLGYQRVDLNDDWGKQYQWSPTAGASLPPSTFQGVPFFGDNETETDFYSAYFSVTGDSLVFESSTGYTERGGDGGLVPLAVGPVIGKLDVGGGADMFTQEFRLLSNIDGPWSWIGGVVYQTGENQEVVELLAANFPPGPMAFPTFRLRESDTTWESESYALFGEIAYAGMDGRLVTTLGLRYFEDDREFSDANVPPGPVFPPPPLGPPPPQPLVSTSSQTFDSTSPRLNIAYYPGESAMYYLNIAKGFRSGTFNTQAGIAAAPPGVGEFVDPDELWSYEVGGKWNMATTAFELAVYYFTWDDIQLNWSGANQIQIQANAGDATGFGIDYAITWRPVEWASLSLNGNINSTEIDQLIDPSLFVGTGIVEGQQLASVPENNHSVQFNMNRPVGSTGNLKFDANLAYTYIDEQGDPGFPLKGFAQDLLRARIGVSSEHWGVHFVGTNLLDADEPIQISGSGVTLYYPRTLGVEVNLRY